MSPLMIRCRIDSYSASIIDEGASVNRDVPADMRPRYCPPKLLDKYALHLD
jgi:hypothetical protein